MRELIIQRNQNILDLPTPDEISGVCVTTNGVVKKNGHAVMGKGNALEIDNYYHVSPLLGKYLTQYGNRVFNLGLYYLSNGVQTFPFRLFSFPTKYDWRNDSDLTLICRSCEQLVELCDKLQISKCFLPPPGCGCGNLDYNVIVKPAIELLLDDRFTVVLRK